MGRKRFYHWSGHPRQLAPSNIIFHRGGFKYAPSPLLLHSQKQLAHWAVDLTAQVVPCWLGSWLNCNLWLVLGQRNQLVCEHFYFLSPVRHPLRISNGIALRYDDIQWGELFLLIVHAPYYPETVWRERGFKKSKIKLKLENNNSTTIQLGSKLLQVWFSLTVSWKNWGSRSHPRKLTSLPLLI